jgi:ribonucleoside-diphosphate reductase alpha chain
MELDQRWIIELASDRQGYIDQGQSVNTFFPADVQINYLHAVHFMAWKKGLKSLYYLRSDKIRKAEKVGSAVELTSIDLSALVSGDGCLACEG